MTAPVNPYARKPVPPPWRPPAPHPSPAVACRLAEMEEIPRNARSLWLLGLRHGWDCQATYARGTDITSKDEPKGLVDSIAVRMSRPGMRLAGLWVDGHFAATVWLGVKTLTLSETRRMVALGPTRGAL